MWSTPCEKPRPPVRNAARHRQRFQVVDRVRDLFVDGARTVLELALNRERQPGVFADAQHVYRAVLPDDGLANPDLPIDLESA